MSAPAPAEGSHLSIGEVLNRLRPDFPDLTISKIRFYEAAGLVEPARTPGGYRKFSAQDVERLRYVLTAKHAHYLPLRVIKDQLEAIDRGNGELAEAALPDTGLRFDLTPSEVRLTREQMLEETGLDAEQLAAIEESGLLHRRRGGYYDGDDVSIARIVAELGRYGLEPRHLRSFKGAADREVGLVEQLVVQPNTRRRGSAGLERSRDTAAEIATRLARLHAALLQAGLRHTLSP
ncbi:MerR family transcriptional regulator [Sporichthya brevicatena]|uniref:MerR family transcriptional regulator n=1 Tax=Sporichthya brevicatena TaxID=171442 RepID=A0ABP3SB98_9ACTN